MCVCASNGEAQQGIVGQSRAKRGAWGRMKGWGARGARAAWRAAVQCWLHWMDLRSMPSWTWVEEKGVERRRAGGSEGVGSAVASDGGCTRQVDAARGRWVLHPPASGALPAPLTAPPRPSSQRAHHLPQRRHLAQLVDVGHRQLHRAIHLGLCGEAPNPKSDRGVGHVLLHPQRAKHVGRLQAGARAGAARRPRHILWQGSGLGGSGGGWKRERRGKRDAAAWAGRTSPSSSAPASTR